MTLRSTSSRAAAPGPSHSDPNCQSHPGSSHHHLFLPSHPPLPRSEKATRQLQDRATDYTAQKGARSVGQTMAPCLAECRARIEGVPLRPVVTTLNEKVAVKENKKNPEAKRHHAEPNIGMPRVRPAWHPGVGESNKRSAPRPFPPLRWNAISKATDLARRIVTPERAALRAVAPTSMIQMRPSAGIPRQTGHISDTPVDMGGVG